MQGTPNTLQMDLVRKFNEESTCEVIPVEKLQVDVNHLILRADMAIQSY
jgi:hypothetical protein